MARWESRLTELRRIPAQQLMDELNPENWRAHPQEQRETMAAVLDRVGLVAPVLVSRRSGMVIDGEMRIQLAASQGAEIECLYVDLDEEEERIALATFDAVGEMAGTDERRLDRALLEFRGNAESPLNALRTTSVHIASMVEAVASGSILSRLWMQEEGGDEEAGSVSAEDSVAMWIRVSPEGPVDEVQAVLRRLVETHEGVRVEGLGFERLG